MTFEDDFPSLKIKTIIQNPYEGPSWQNKINYVDIKDIQEHCLDKQKVRDAIAYYEKNGVGRYEDFKEWLKKELGL